MDLIFFSSLAAVLSGTISALVARRAYRKELRRRDHGPFEEILVERTERQPVTLRASRRVPDWCFLDLLAKFDNRSEAVGLWVAEQLIRENAGRLAELARVTVDQDWKQGEHLFEMKLMVLPPR